MRCRLKTAETAEDIKKSRVEYLGQGIQGGICPPLPPDFGRSVNPIPTRGQIVPTTLLLAARIFIPSASFVDLTGFAKWEEGGNCLPGSPGPAP